MSTRFDNRFVQNLPADPSSENHPRQVYGAAYSAVAPTAVAAPRLLGWSEALGAELGIAKPSAEQDEWLQALAGNRLIDGMQSYAMCYGGHQFGHWAGQLGDGRAIALGELIAPNKQHWELQLKGAGPTPYSRSADGRAVLRSSLREFLCSEAMHALGVPTTRALSLIGSGEPVMRDMFYDGRAQNEPGAIVCRTAPSFIRFGSFELPTSRGDTALLEQLVSYTIRTHFPEFAEGEELDIEAWFGEVCERTASLMVEWMRVGFVHGVMNTDNMSIHGLTIDYGPYGWLEPYDLDWTPNTTDAQGRRYSFGQQPGIGQWNLNKLAGALAPLLDDVQVLSAGLERYADVFHAQFGRSFGQKIGIADLSHEDELLGGLFACMRQTETDYCLTFRLLADLPLHLEASDAHLDEWLDVLAPAFYDESARTGEARAAWQYWFQAYRQRVNVSGQDAQQRRAEMNAVNPLYVPRNYLAQQAIDAASEGDTSELEALQRVLGQPYTEQPGCEKYAQRRPEWARNKAGCSALSCSS